MSSNLYQTLSGMAKKIIVTGGNAGIGFALCKQLVIEHGCHVFMGSRNAERGAIIVLRERTKPKF